MPDVAVSPSRIRAVANVLIVACSVIALENCNRGHEAVLRLRIIGEGQVHLTYNVIDETYNSDCSSVCNINYSSLLAMSAMGGNFTGWICDPDRAVESTEPTLDFVNPPGFSREDSCVAMFGSVREVTFQIERDPADLGGSAWIRPDTGPDDTVCEIPYLGRLMLGSCTCQVSCTLFARDGTRLVIASGDPAMDIRAVEGDCVGPSLLVDRDNLSCRLQLRQPRLTIAITGNGRVTSDPPGIDCQGTDPLLPDVGTCSAPFALGLDVTLSTRPNTGARFLDWQGPCALPGGLTMNEMDKDCAAVFEGGVIVGQAGVVDLVSVDPAGGNLNWVAGRTDARTTVDLSTDGHTAAFLGRIPSLATPLSYYSRHLPDAGAAFTRTLSPTAAQFANAQNLSVSGDGRFVAFMSDDPALNGVFGLLPPPGGSHRVFVQDTENGTVQLVSGNDLASGVEVLDQTGTHATISDNGRWVAFVGRLVRRNGNLVVNETIFRVLLRDTCAGVSGCTPTTVVASATTDGLMSINPNSGTHLSVEPTLSPDGRYLAYRSNSLFLATDGAADGLDTSFRILLRDRDADGDGRFDQAGGVTQQVVSLSQTPGGFPLSAPFPARPVISADGRFVLYRETSLNLLQEVFSPILRYDSCAGTIPGTCVTRTFAVRGSGDDFLDQFNDNADIGADGRYVAMIGSLPTVAFTVLVRDTCLGAAAPDCIPQTRTPALNAAGNPVASTSHPRLSGDGGAVVFTSNVGILPGDTSGDQDAFLAQTGFMPDPALEPVIHGVALEGTPLGAVGNSLPAGTGEVLITVGGDNFSPGARIEFDGTAVGTIYEGRNKLQFRTVTGASRTNVPIKVINGAQSADFVVDIQ